MDQERPQSGSRRSFLRSSVLAWSVFVAAILTAAAGVMRVMFPNVQQEPPTPSEFEARRINEVQTGVDLRFQESKILKV